MDYVQEVFPNLFLVDVGHFGETGLGGAYILLVGGEAALFDTGPSLARDRILGALEFLGIPRAVVRWIFLTHIHLDHAGGAGVLVPELPNARVVVHPRGAKHLLDPARLLSSTQSATGPRFRFYGTAVPIPEERLFIAADGTTLPLGSQEVQVIDAPGHAPHHLCFFLPGSGLLFTGDAAGLYLKGRLLPTTVPPNFDLELWLSTLDRLSALRPQKLLFTHFGPGEPGLLGVYKELLLAWMERVLRHKDEPEEEAVAAILGELREEGWPVGPGVSGDWTMSVRGVLLYLRGKEGGG